MNTTTTPRSDALKKTTDKIFNKIVYLLGEDAEGIRYWLEAPKWDCGWYWGFGYIETYTNNKTPNKSRDIDSHQHADGEYKGSDYDTNIFTGNFLVKKTFDDKQGWILRELMATFYQLRKQAEMVGRGGMNVTANPHKFLLLDQKQAEHINKTQIPAVTEAICIILDGGKKS